LLRSWARAYGTSRALSSACDDAQVVDEPGEHLVPVLGTQNGARVDRRDDEVGQLRVERLAAFLVTLKLFPSSAWAAVAPSRTSARGLTSASSASSQGRQAIVSVQVGLSWMRRVPRAFHLKCLTAFVT
jgi:hypothetical protein